MPLLLPRAGRLCYRQHQNLEGAPCLAPAFEFEADRPGSEAFRLGHRGVKGEIRRLSTPNQMIQQRDLRFPDRQGRVERLVGAARGIGSNVKFQVAAVAHNVLRSQTRHRHPWRFGSQREALEAARRRMEAGLQEVPSALKCRASDP